MISNETFKRAFRRLAASVCCITTHWKGDPYGFVATSVSSLTSEPPTLLVCVNKAVSSHEPIVQSGILCVNVLRDGDHAVAALFADKDLRHTRFSKHAWTTRKTGAPVLPDALVAFDCIVETKVSYGTHTVFIARILDVQIENSLVEKPLLFFDGGYRELGERVC
jgi:flavin reductase